MASFQSVMKSPLVSDILTVCDRWQVSSDNIL